MGDFFEPPKHDLFLPHTLDIYIYIHIVVVCFTFQVGEENNKEKGIFSEKELDLALPLVGTLSMIEKLSFDMFAWAIPKGNSSSNIFQPSMFRGKHVSFRGEGFYGDINWSLTSPINAAFLRQIFSDPLR